MVKFKSIGKKLSAVVLSAVMAVSAMAITGTASAATVDSYDKVTSVTFNIHKSEVDETTAADDSEGKIGNTAGLTGTTQDAPDNYKGLKDANFAMYKVGDINETFEEYDTNDEKIAEAWRVVKSRNIQAIELNPTDKNGLTSVTLNRSQFGLYLVTEVTPVPDAVTTTAQDFLVYLPMTAQNDSNQGEAWLTQGDASVFVEDGKNQYTLTETKTNNGYQLLTAPFEIIVTEGTYDIDNSVTIKNAPQPALPMTGGAGTAMFIIIGTLAIAAGAFFFIKSKKKIEE